MLRTGLRFASMTSTGVEQNQGKLTLIGGPDWHKIVPCWGVGQSHDPPLSTSSEGPEYADSFRAFDIRNDEFVIAVDDANVISVHRASGIMSHQICDSVKLVLSY